MDNNKNLIEEPAVNVEKEDSDYEDVVEVKTEGVKAKPSTHALKDAWKQVETIGQSLGEALQSRGNVVMARVNDDMLAHLDMIVEAEICKSRSEAAALLISEGIKSNAALFERIREITDQIAALRSQLRDVLQRDKSAGEPEEDEEEIVEK